MPDIGGWQQKYAHNLTIAIVSRGTTEANLQKGNGHRLTNVLLQREREVSDLYRANGTPSAVIVSADGTIGSALALGADAIRSLISHATGVHTPAFLTRTLPPMVSNHKGNNGNGRTHIQPTSLPSIVGKPVPDIKLPDLNGITVSLIDLRGNEVLVLFWNPHCGFCNRMLNDLKGWEANPPAGLPKLLLISAGTIDENRAMGLRSPILLDPYFSIGRNIGANGTPSAVLIDGKGTIISQVAIGANEIFGLVQQRVQTVDSLT
jgi:peroxiredoxin